MLGLSAWKAGDYQLSEQAFERALELDSNHVKSHLNLSRVLLDTGRPMDALDRINDALAIDPESNAAYRLKGRMFRQVRQNPQAVEAYRRAIQIDDQDAWSMNNLGMIYLQEDMVDKALPPLARAVELRRDVAMFRNNLGMALELSGRYRAAEDVYRTAVDTDPMNEKAAENLARIEQVREELDIEPVDLAELSQRFADEIAGWEKIEVTQVPTPAE
jgi:superkiller protein 3